MKISALNTDSRSIKNGDIFVAIKGDIFDGHNFIGEAIKRGATGAIVRSGFKMTGEMKQMKLFVEVEDTLVAYQDVAAYNRAENSAKVIAIAGSSGKTTTKEMLKEIILQKTAEIVVSEKNFNNFIGVPMTLLKISKNHEIAVIEIGINQINEMEKLAQITNPDIALVTNAGSAHLEFLMNVDTVAKEKMKLADGLKDGGTLIVNCDDLRLLRCAKAKSVNLLTFGFSKSADIIAESFEDISLNKSLLKVRIDGNVSDIKLKTNGRHNAYNALSAIAVATKLDIPMSAVIKGLMSFTPKDMRCENIYLNDNIIVINDAYNANPDSMEASLRTFKELKSSGRKIAVLGDMFELGEYSSRAHKDVGAMAANFKIDALFFYGKEMMEAAKCAGYCGMEKKNIYWFNDHDVLFESLYSNIKSGDWVLIKGSRLNKLEIIANRLIEKIGIVTETNK